MQPAYLSISKLGVEAAKRQTKNELKIQKKNNFLMFQEKDHLHTPHTPPENRRFCLGIS